MNYERVTDFQREATGRISGVVVKEAAKQISSENLKPKGPLGNGKVHRLTVSRDVGEPEWLCLF